MLPVVALTYPVPGFLGPVVEAPGGFAREFWPHLVRCEGSCG